MSERCPGSEVPVDVDWEVLQPPDFVFNARAFCVVCGGRCSLFYDGTDWRKSVHNGPDPNRDAIDAFAKLRGDTPLRMAELIDHVRAEGLNGQFRLTEFITLDLDAIRTAQLDAPRR